MVILIGRILLEKYLCNVKKQYLCLQETGIWYNIHVKDLRK